MFQQAAAFIQQDERNQHQDLFAFPVGQPARNGSPKHREEGRHPHNDANHVGPYAKPIGVDGQRRVEHAVGGSYGKRDGHCQDEIPVPQMRLIGCLGFLAQKTSPFFKMQRGPPRFGKGTLATMKIVLYSFQFRFFHWNRYCFGEIPFLSRNTR